MKQIRYQIEALFARLLYHSFRALPLDMSSNIGGRVARWIGPKTKVHKVAAHNLKLALPEISSEERDRLLVRMWDNLGRVFCEYPHLDTLAMRERVVSVTGAEHLTDAMKQQRPILIISGHVGNWELPPVISAEKGVPLHLLYRAANNVAVDQLIASIRGSYTLGLHDKGRRAARAIIKAMQNHEPVAMLVDQKSNDGINVPFFGQDAMTNDAVAHLVLKHNPLVIPSRSIRKEGCRFAIEVEAPMEFTLTGDAEADTQSIMRDVHALLERWIKQDPAQWFWVHKRWPHSKKAAKR